MWPHPSVLVVPVLVERGGWTPWFHAGEWDRFDGTGCVILRTRVPVVRAGGRCNRFDLRG